MEAKALSEGNIASLPTPGRKTRTHVTVPLDELARLLAEAEDAGVRHALQDASAWEKMERLIERSATFDIRVKLYAAMLQARYV